ncbi:MAG: hypothetical protein NTY67_01815 [Cyanobacteria bacterium]|nr:hypothetical protein [Cyanobacteriota bacterium]
MDRSIVDLQGPEARASQVDMKARSMRLTLEAALINGDAIASQARGFDGLAKRLTPGAEMAINNVSTNNLGVMAHHYQECQILTVDRDAQGLKSSAKCPTPPSSAPASTGTSVFWRTTHERLHGQSPARCRHRAGRLDKSLRHT